MSSSVNASQTTDSSMQHSSLNISVGDTKSIVLALQALQTKIRQLEKDRDYHHNQYQLMLQTHASFKATMEEKMESEREAHRHRENELSNLLRTALEEKSKLSAIASSSRDSLLQMRKEIEEMIKGEKNAAESRESRLRCEIQDLQNRLKEEKIGHTATVLKLEEAMADVMKYQTSAKRVLPAEVSGRRYVGETTPGKEGRAQRPISAECHEMSNVNGLLCRNCNCALSPEETKQALYRANRSRTYRDPTCNSMLRDKRNVCGTSPCVHQCSNEISESRGNEGREEAYYSQPPEVHLTSSSPSYPAQGIHSSNPLLMRTPVRSGTPLRQSSVSGSSLRGEKGRAASSQPPRRGACEDSLEREIMVLKRRLQEFVSSSFLSQMAVSEMRSHFQKLTAMIARKEEQLAMLRSAKNMSYEGNQQKLINEMREITSNALGRTKKFHEGRI